MHTQKWMRIVITLVVISRLLITYGAPVRVAAAEEATFWQELNPTKPIHSPHTITTQGAASVPLSIEGEPLAETTLSVRILRSP
jgi:hypothetical protein